MDIFIAIEFLLPQSLGFITNFMQLLQAEPYIINTYFLRSLIG